MSAHRQGPAARRRWRSVAHLHTPAVRREVTQAKPNVGARGPASLIPRPRRGARRRRAPNGFCQSRVAGGVRGARRRARARDVRRDHRAGGVVRGPRASPSPTASMRPGASSSASVPESAAKALVLVARRGRRRRRRRDGARHVAPANERERDWTSRRDSASVPRVSRRSPASPRPLRAVPPALPTPKPAAADGGRGGHRRPSPRAASPRAPSARARSAWWSRAARHREQAVAVRAYVVTSARRRA